MKLIIIWPGSLYVKLWWRSQPSSWVIWSRKHCWVPCIVDHWCQYLLPHFGWNNPERSALLLEALCTWPGIVWEQSLGLQFLPGLYGLVVYFLLQSKKGKLFACPISSIKITLSFSFFFLIQRLKIYNIFGNSTGRLGRHFIFTWT